MTQPQASRIAAVQMVSGPDVTANLAAAGELVARAADAGARLVALPEYFALLSADEGAKVAARERDGTGPMQDWLAATAARHGVWLVGGTIPLVAGDANRVRNSVLVFDEAGRRVARYDKLHLFGFDDGAQRFDESRTIEAGERVVCVDTPLGRLGLSVCYDLRFPELYRAMGAVDLILVPSAFTATTGRAHWEVLLRARAIENQCHVAAPAQGGVHPGGRRTWGHTMIVDPWGEVLGCREADGEGIVLADLDAARREAVRTQLPALRHRRGEAISRGTSGVADGPDNLTLDGRNKT
jgi:nitrilase